MYARARWPALWQCLYELNEHDDPSILLGITSFQLEEGSEFGDANSTAHCNCLDHLVLQPELFRETQPEDTLECQATVLKVNGNG